MTTFNWASATRSLAHAPISFVRASPALLSPPLPDPAEGKRAKEFYESIVNDDETKETRRRRRRRRKSGEGRRWRKSGRPEGKDMNRDDRSCINENHDAATGASDDVFVDGNRANASVEHDPVAGPSYDILIDDSSSSGCKIERESVDRKPTIGKAESPPFERSNADSNDSREVSSRINQDQASTTESDDLFGSARLGPVKVECATSIHHSPDLSEPSSSSSSSFSVASLRSKRLRYKFFAAAQRGDVDTVVACIGRGVGVDERDDFGWTALMIATSAGSLEVAGYLIQVGADKFKSTSGGVSAMTLVDGTEQEDDVKKRLKELLNDDDDDDYDDVSHIPTSVIHFCEACDSCYAELQTEHLQSVSHLLKLNGVGKDAAAKPDLSVFEIAGNNRGYKLMVDKMGWDANSGLGKEGEGRRYPIKTQMKRDRKGLGVDDREKKKGSVAKAALVTASVDANAVRPSTTRTMRQNTVSRIEAQRRTMKEKKWEIRLRRYMRE